jgi:hypothetical protein
LFAGFYVGELRQIVIMNEFEQVLIGSDTDFRRDIKNEAFVISLPFRIEEIRKVGAFNSIFS